MEGRFISKDPIGFAGGDVTLYGYVQDNSINLTDPDGLCFFGGSSVALGRPWLLPAETVKPRPFTPPDAIPISIPTPRKGRDCDDNNDDPCDKFLDKTLRKKAKVFGREEEIKAHYLDIKYGGSKYDLCGCNDGRVVIKLHGCKKGDVIEETKYTWK